MSGKIVALFLLLILSRPLYAQDPLHVIVSIEFKGETVSKALLLLSERIPSQLAFNPDILPKKKVTATYRSAPLKAILDDLLGTHIQYKVHGHYVILLPSPNEGKKNEIELSGKIKDAKTGENLSDVTVYDVTHLTATLSSATGNFNVASKTAGERAVFAISKENYQDTIITVDHGNKPYLSLFLEPLAYPPLANQGAAIDTTKLFKLLTSEKTKKHMANVHFDDTKFIQLSLVPGLGSNGFLGGRVTNRYSINIIGGYANGLSGLEVAGAFNLIRNNVNGMQFAGFLNANGRELTGAQVAGAVNSCWGEANGSQIAGALNITKKKLTGAQISGFWNISGEVIGGQIAGALNTSKGMNGLQLAGVINLSEDANCTQISGALNKANDLNGIQITGAVNKSEQLRGIQLSGAYNHASKAVYGLQVSGGVNYTSKLNGIQIGIINIAKKVEKGAMIGLLNFTKAGILAFEVSHNDLTAYNCSFKSGTKALYTILSAGVSNNLEMWSSGFGMGTQFKLKGKYYTGLELSSHQLWISNTSIFENEQTVDYRIHIPIGFSFSKRISVNMGPMLHILSNDQGTNSIPKTALFNLSSSHLKSWIGYRLALRI